MFEITDAIVDWTLLGATCIGVSLANEATHAVARKNIKKECEKKGINPYASDEDKAKYRKIKAKHNILASGVTLGLAAGISVGTCYGIENSQNIANALNTKFNPQPQIDAADGVEII